MIRGVAVVRLVGENIEPGVFKFTEALRLAEQFEVDLVEISPNADPPVCKLMDYGKFIYEQKKRDKMLKAKSTQIVVKEIRFGPQTDEHDYEFKRKNSEKFLKEGSKTGIASTLPYSSKSCAKRNNKICPCSLYIIERPLKKTNAFNLDPSFRNFSEFFLLNS